ncbi:subclass B3 metallo-beta-lactamase [Pseudoduganella namucuonensis]|nr:subclass B3 metallo-beta-lactamase [Pseudoduganella namucuonensis]
MLRALSAALIMALAPTAVLAHDNCTMCEEWNAPQAPFSLYGNSYYVGVRGLSAVLITGPSGHVLIDGALPESAPLIVDNIRRLGFRIQDVKYILNSHAHFDHAGGIAELQRLSGARVLAPPLGAQVLRTGKALPQDAQFGDLSDVAVVADVRTLADGETVKLPGLEVTAHYTPGHAPGGASWSWKSCEGDKCANMVFADSLSAIPFNNYKFSAHPSVMADFERSFAKVESLPCDVMLSAHPEASDLWTRQARQKELGNAAMVDPGACRAYAARARANFAKRLAAERG